MLRFSFERLQPPTTAAAHLLDSAFGVRAYTESFPHIFSSDASALIACARTADGELLGLCAVDTEIWSEPQTLRGACLGSVAVLPRVQGQGVGTQLLRWVASELTHRACHDFIYLFSEESRFYEALGFTAAGRERLFTVAPTPAEHTGTERRGSTAVQRLSMLSDAQLRRVWWALERCRRHGESHAGWLKFVQTSRIHDLWIAWSEGPSGDVRAGGFIGKGVDFQGVLHNLFAESDAALHDFLHELISSNNSLTEHILVAPGLWSQSLTHILKLSHEQNLCYVRPLTLPAPELQQLFQSGRVYPRSLFSS